VIAFHFMIKANLCEAPVPARFRTLSARSGRTEK